MKKLLLSAIALAATAFAGYAAEGTTLVMKEVYNVVDKTINPAPTTVTVGNYTINVDKTAAGTTAPACNVAGDLRLYAKNTITISTTGAPMTSLVFNLSAQGERRLTAITASAGAVAAQAVGDKTVSWTGNATSVTFTVGDKATFGSDGAAKAGQFAFLSIDINGGGSSAGGGDVTPVENHKVASIAEFLTNPSTVDTYEFTNPVTVVHQYNYTSSKGNLTCNLYVQDATGGLLIFGDTKQTYAKGDVIPAGFTGKYSLYKGCSEFTDPAGFQAPSSTGAELTLAEMAVEEISTADEARYIVVKDVTITADTDPNYYNVEQNGTTIQMYNKFNIEVTPGANYNVTGVINVYQPVATEPATASIYPIEITPAQGGGESGLTSVAAAATAPAEYFTLQGVRVSNPDRGLYIRRQGTKVTKVSIR